MLYLIIIFVEVHDITFVFHTCFTFFFKETRKITFFTLILQNLKKKRLRVMNNDVLPIGATKKYELKALQGKLFCLRQRNIR